MATWLTESQQLQPTFASPSTSTTLVAAPPAESAAMATWLVESRPPQPGFSSPSTSTTLVAAPPAEAAAMATWLTESRPPQPGFSSPSTSTTLVAAPSAGSAAMATWLTESRPPQPAFSSPSKSTTLVAAPSAEPAAMATWLTESQQLQPTFACPSTSTTLVAAPPAESAAMATWLVESRPPQPAFSSPSTSATPLPRYSWLNEIPTPWLPFPSVPAAARGFTFSPTSSSRPSTARYVDDGLGFGSVFNPSLPLISSANSIGTSFFSPTRRNNPVQSAADSFPYRFGGSNDISVNPSFADCFRAWRNQAESSSAAGELGRSKQAPPLPYRCSECDMRFPTPQAYGGHMSSHSKARKAQPPPGEALVPLKRARLTSTTPSIPERGAQLVLRAPDLDRPVLISRTTVADEEDALSGPPLGSQGGESSDGWQS
ncbi:hypothetical protein B296_00033993 [Ensete ventricosum]|uniref:C2H2-type domain-containing protein n=1 Tax=Ensete ventricosum TaxID=4639 RepID=A0A426Z6V0_ENSVE|nr:hypothetical protein B296_00033993 [Ensete ventricosum]